MATNGETSAGRWRWGFSKFAQDQLAEAEKACGRKFVSEVKRNVRGAMRCAARGIELDGGFLPDGVPDHMEDVELYLLNRGWAVKGGEPSGFWDGFRKLAYYGRTMKPPLELWHFGEEVYDILGSYDHEVTAFIRLKRHVRTAEVLAFVEFPAGLGL